MRLTKVKVLLVDDHALVREGIRQLLEAQEDIQVAGEASNGEQAIGMVAKVKPTTILMDIAMPGMDGIETTRRIKRAHPSVNIIVLTAYDNDEFVMALLKAGVSGYLLKNTKREELLQAIRVVSHGESVLDPAVTKKVIMRMQPDPTSAQVRRTTSLSRRELEVLRLGAKGLINKEIAEKLSLGERTVQTHWRNIFNKLGVSTRVEAIMHSLRKGWLAMETDDKQ